MKKVCLFFIFLFLSLCMMGKVDAFSCDYECDDKNCGSLSTFTLNIDPDNQSITLSDTITGFWATLYDKYHHKIDESLPTQWFNSGEPNKCRGIFVCTYHSASGMEMRVDDYYYNIYADDGSAKNDYVYEILNMPWWKKFIIELGGTFYSNAKCYYAKYKGDDTTLVPSSTPYKCATFNNGINSIRSLYTEIGSASKGTDVSSQYKKVNAEIEKLQAYCNGAYASFDYTSDCVRDCTHLEEEISSIKVQNGIDSGSSRITECGISERIADWIIKIISWVRYIIPVLLIVLSILDFMKAIAADSEDDIKKSASRFIKRLIVSVVIFLLPLLLEFILGIFGVDAKGFCL